MPIVPLLRIIRKYGFNLRKDNAATIIRYIELNKKYLANSVTIIMLTSSA